MLGRTRVAGTAKAAEVSISRRSMLRLVEAFEVAMKLGLNAVAVARRVVMMASFMMRLIKCK